MEEHPLISVVIPVYNGSNYLAQAIQSVLDQTYKNFEIIVVNDGSTDGGKTKEVAQSFGSRIRYYEKNNGGVYTALNYGLHVMKGSLFLWLSHDDLIHHDMLKRHIEQRSLMKLRDNIITYNYHQDINEKGERLNYITSHNNVDQVPYALTFSFPIYCCSILLPRKILEEINGFDECYIWSDHKFLVDLASRYFFCNIPKVLTYKRTHPDQITTQKKYQNKSMVRHTNDALIYAMDALVKNRNVHKKFLEEVSIVLSRKGYCLAAINAYNYFRLQGSSGGCLILLSKIRFNCMLKLLKRNIKQLLVKHMNCFSQNII